MKKLLRIAALAAALTLFLGAALADAVTFDGKVTAGATCEVITPLGGTVETVAVKAGDRVKRGDELATLRTVRAVAAQDGVVTAVFGQPGDSAADVAARYGAVVYLEGEVKYTISVSLSNAYSAIDTTFVHAGQKVWLRGKNNIDHKGTGMITALDASSYTVEVLTGDFIVGESVNLYMDDTMYDNTRVGRGTVNRRAPEAITVEAGTLVRLAVSAGAQVKRGDLLFETLSGTCEPGEAADVICAGTDGVVASVSAVQGSALAEDAVVAVIYPADAMQIEGSVPESDLAGVQVGSPADVTLYWNEDSAVRYPGVITWISAVADAAEGTETAYTVRVAFTPDADTRYGMNATVTVARDEAAAETAE